MLDTRKMSVEEIRQQLITGHGVDKDVVDNIKGKSNLVNFMQSLNKVEEPVSSDEDFGFQIIQEQPKETEDITITSSRWTDYVLKQLSEDEKDKANNHPKTDGLRRLVEKLISPIVRTRVKVIQAPSIENNMVSTVKVGIILGNGQSYEACADTQAAKCPSPYDAFLSAIAETRAKGRVYREILRLQNVCTAEEITSKGEGFSDERINNMQKVYLTAMCDTNRLNINVLKALNYHFKDKVRTNISDYSREQGQQISEIISDYQQDMSKIPTEILGYDSNWKN